MSHACEYRMFDWLLLDVSKNTFYFKRRTRWSVIGDNLDDTTIVVVTPTKTSKRRIMTTALYCMTYFCTADQYDLRLTRLSKSIRTPVD